MDYFEKTKIIAEGFTKKYPSGKDPFKLVTLLTEELGELAKSVNHFEGTGKKLEKYGEARKENLAGEVRDVMHLLQQLVLYYDMEDELKATIDAYYEEFSQAGD